MFTRTSVHCAERIVATWSSSALVWTSSQRASGCRKRRPSRIARARSRRTSSGSSARAARRAGLAGDGRADAAARRAGGAVRADPPRRAGAALFALPALGVLAARADAALRPGFAARAFVVAPFDGAFFERAVFAVPFVFVVRLVIVVSAFVARSAGAVAAPREEEGSRGGSGRLISRYASACARRPLRGTPAWRAPYPRRRRRARASTLCAPAALPRARCSRATATWTSPWRKSRSSPRTSSQSSSRTSCAEKNRPALNLRTYSRNRGSRETASAVQVRPLMPGRSPPRARAAAQRTRRESRSARPARSRGTTACVSVYCRPEPKQDVDEPIAPHSRRAVALVRRTRGPRPGGAPHRAGGISGPRDPPLPREARRPRGPCRPGDQGSRSRRSRGRARAVPLRRGGVPRERGQLLRPPQLLPERGARPAPGDPDHARADRHGGRATPAPAADRRRPSGTLRPALHHEGRDDLRRLPRRSEAHPRRLPGDRVPGLGR